MSFFLHGTFVLKYADSSNQRGFFLHGSVLFYEYVQSNQSNTRDRKKPSQQEQTFFCNALLFFSAHLFRVYSIESLWPKQVTSLRGPSPRHCARATQLLSKNVGKVATLCLIWLDRDLNLKSPALETNALLLDQLAGSSNPCPLNMLLFRSHQEEIIIVKRLIQVRDNMTRIRVEPRPCDQGHRKNNTLTHSVTINIYQKPSAPNSIESKI